MLLATALLIIGLLLVVYSADRLVFAASLLCRSLGVPPLLIGITVSVSAPPCPKSSSPSPPRCMAKPVSLSARR